ncbi:hypothetical protein [Acanthopleuribacter pedis]|uniref:Uncharacterized protein n=1 Tax=Acanthopleuribacter pedis TaxID=442870 RepID=A0A8J7QLG6_9BACT|nr:hypothetical protein [Acanthopleuribacter pedis]MBO1320468.1 hypothetical protein [Acanthopleuribacter pedis]
MFHGTVIRLALGFWAFFLSSPFLWSQITPTDVHRLASDINYSVKRAYDINQTFEKIPLSQSIKPRNVYQKVCYLHLEYGQLHPGFTNQARINGLLNRDTKTIGPGDVYRLLDEVAEDLKKRGEYTAAPRSRGSKSPSDVFQMLRAVSHTLKTAAGQTQKTAYWGPSRVFMLNYTKIQPILTNLAETRGTQRDAFQLPKEAAENITPQHIFAFQLTLYAEIARYYQTSAGYQPIEFAPFSDFANLSPEDVFDLSLIILGELKVLHGSYDQGAETFEAWRNSVGMVKPGHVYYLLRYNFFLAVQTLK